MSELRILDLEQRSPEWYAARCGLVTASAMNTLVTVGTADAKAVDCPECKASAGELCVSLSATKDPKAIKTIHGERTDKAKSLPPVYAPADNDTSKALVLALAAERITKHVEDTFITHDMYRGIDSEPYARDLYAEHCTKEPVIEAGFMVRNFEAFSIGYSPDGLVGDDGLIEIKAPRQKGHLSTVVNAEVPAQHMAQLQTGLLVAGREWIDFVSYNGGMHLWPKRVTADPAWQAAILQAAEKAERDIEAHVATYYRAVEGLPLAERIDFQKVELRGIA
jgi:hypothetical protein